MSLKLQDFDAADDEVTKRGREYFISGAVTTLDDTGHGEWVASVSGSQEYEVEISLKKDTIIDSDCSCYFFQNNQYCKHVAAVLFAIRDKKTKPAKDKKSKEPKVKSPLQQLQQAADMMEIEHLRDFIKAHAIHNKDFTNSFLFHAMQVAIADDPTENSYRGLIRQAIESSTERSKKYNHIDDDKLSRYIRPLLDQARKHVAGKNYLDASYVMRAMIEELGPLSGHSSSGDKTIGLLLQSSELLQAIGTAEVPYTFKDELFDYCISKVESGIFANISVERAFNNVLLHLAIDQQKREQLLDLLNKKIKKTSPDAAHPHYPYHHPLWLDYFYMKIDLLHLMRRDTEAIQLIRQSVAYHEDIRKKAIELALRDRDYKYAKELTNQRLSELKETTGFRFNKNIWFIYLLRIAEAENDKAEVVRLASDLFLTTVDMSYYKIIKKQFSAQDWKNEVELMIKKITARHGSVEFIGRIYAEENMTEQLFALVKKYPNIHILLSFANTLIPAYRLEFLSLYKTSLLTFAKEAFTPNYVIIRDHLNHLIALGASDIAEEIKNEFQEIYKGRPKLIEQLSKVKLPS